MQDNMGVADKSSNKNKVSPIAFNAILVAILLCLFLKYSCKPSSYEGTYSVGMQCCICVFFCINVISSFLLSLEHHTTAGGGIAQ